MPDLRSWWESATPEERAVQIWGRVNEAGDCLHLRQHGEEGRWEASFCGSYDSRTKKKAIGHGDTALDAIYAALLALEAEP